MRNFRDYDIWKNSICLAKKIYNLTDSFPQNEKYGLTSQIQRASISIASNIAEGCSRSSEKEFRHFLEIAQGSSFEVETQIILATEIGYLKNIDLTELFNELHIIQKQINNLCSRLK